MTTELNCPRCNAGPTLYRQVRQKNKLRGYRCYQCGGIQVHRISPDPQPTSLMAMRSFQRFAAEQGCAYVVVLQPDGIPKTFFANGATSDGAESHVEPSPNPRVWVAARRSYVQAVLARERGVLNQVQARVLKENLAYDAAYKEYRRIAREGGRPPYPLQPQEPDSTPLHDQMNRVAQLDAEVAKLDRLFARPDLNDSFQDLAPEYAEQLPYVSDTEVARGGVVVSRTYAMPY